MSSGKVLVISVVSAGWFGRCLSVSASVLDCMLQFTARVLQRAADDRILDASIISSHACCVQSSEALWFISRGDIVRLETYFQEDGRLTSRRDWRLTNATTAEYLGAATRSAAGIVTCCCATSLGQPLAAACCAQSQIVPTQRQLGPVIPVCLQGH